MKSKAREGYPMARRLPNGTIEFLTNRQGGLPDHRDKCRCLDCLQSFLYYEDVPKVKFRNPFFSKNKSCISDKV